MTLTEQYKQGLIPIEQYVRGLIKLGEGDLNWVYDVVRGVVPKEHRAIANKLIETKKKRKHDIAIKKFLGI